MLQARPILLAVALFVISFGLMMWILMPVSTVDSSDAANATTALASPMLPAGNKKDLELMLINGGAIIGQSMACGVSKDRLLKVMTVQFATVHFLSNGDPKVLKVRDDMIKLAAANEKSRAVPRCGVIEGVFSSFEKMLMD